VSELRNVVLFALALHAGGHVSLAAKLASHNGHVQGHPLGGEACPLAAAQQTVHIGVVCCGSYAARLDQLLVW
jgi:hypothetical protein